MAGAIAGKIRDNERVSVTAIGPESVYNTVQAIAISRTYMEEDNVDIKFSPQFIKINVQGEDRYCVCGYCCPFSVDFLSFFFLVGSVPLLNTFNLIMFLFVILDRRCIFQSSPDGCSHWQ